jgi:hypothetical protein
MVKLFDGQPGSATIGDPLEHILERLSNVLRAQAVQGRQVFRVDLGQVPGRKEDGLEAEGMGLLDPRQRLSHGADLPAETNLAEDGQDDPQVGRGLLDGHPAGDVVDLRDNTFFPFHNGPDLVRSGRLFSISREL